MDELRFQRIMLWIMIAMNLGACGVNLYMMNENTNIFSLKTSSTEIENISQCENLSLRDSAGCLRDWIDGFYNYTITPDSLIRTLDDIKQNGGDCFDYNANLYVSAGDKLGFNMTTKNFPVGDSWHVIAIMSNAEGYCTLDLNNSPTCFFSKLKNNQTSGPEKKDGKNV